MNKVINVVFYKTVRGKEPVKDWLVSLSEFNRRIIGQEIKTVEYGWPQGMPLVRKLAEDLWEVRVCIQGGIARVMFTLKGHQMVLLHGFVKKSQKTPKMDLDLAIHRLKDI